MARFYDRLRDDRQAIHINDTIIISTVKALNRYSLFLFRRL